MQAGKLFLLTLLFELLLLTVLPFISLAATLQSFDQSGLCCKYNILKESSKKTCEQNRGIFYSAKESVKAQLECGSRQTIIPGAGRENGFCCASGRVKKTTKNQCSEMRGRYYRSNTSAQQSCRADLIFCCTEGRIDELAFDVCLKQEGSIYKSLADAERRCKAVAGTRSRFTEKPLKSPQRIVLPDLLISRFSASPKQIKSGDTVRLTVQIKNTGKQSLRKLTIAFYDLNSNKIVAKKVVSIAGGASKYASTMVSLTGKGRVKIAAIVDPDRKIKESNEKNNEIKTTVSIMEPIESSGALVSETLPDLIPLTLKLDRRAVSANELITIRATIKNVGIKPLNRVIPVEFLVDDSVISVKKIRVPINSTRSISVDYAVRRAGQHIFSVIIDPEAVIAERNEKNNNRAIRVEVMPQQVFRYVPGQIVLLVDGNEQGRKLLQKLVARYGLTVVGQQTLASLQRTMVVCETKEDVHLLNRKLQQEKALYGSQPNFIFSTMSGNDPLHSMQSIDALLDLEVIHQRSTGKNVRVAVIDTGVDLQHEDLQDCVKLHNNFIIDSVYQGEIHGTAVAGIIAARRNHVGITGIAPDADILAYRACKQRSKDQPEGECYSASVAAAIDAAIMAKARIANLSIGSKRSDPLISTLINEGNRRGIHFVAPVGNNSHALSIRFPASHPKVIAVAGFDEMSKPVPNKHLAQSADAVAPSEHIFSAVPGDHYNFVNGTSFSAATITALIALSLEDGDVTVSKKLPLSTKAVYWKEQFSDYIDL